MLDIRPIILRQANSFILKHHRHHHTARGNKFSIGCYKDDELVGVAIIGRPISRKLDNGLTAEVIRLCTIGNINNVASKLLGASARISKEMGYKKIITYILASESGISLKASGWECEDDKCGKSSWNSSKNIQRSNVIYSLFGEKKKYPNELKKRYRKIL